MSKPNPKAAGKPDDKRPATKGKGQEVVEEVPKPVDEGAAEKNVVHIETEGFGKFEFIDGTVYEGQWKLVNNVKKRHGEGVLRHPGSSSDAGEGYRGTWEDDLMHGYGVYRYTNGAVYSGEWARGKQEGRGLYEFPNGSKYEGEWKDHKMHGDGAFTDVNGNKFEGIFVEGIFQSKLQKQLKHEKQLKVLEVQILESSREFFKKFESTFAVSNKKNFKENLTPFFAVAEDIKSYFKEPYPKFDERAPEKWDSAFQFVSNYTNANPLRAPEKARFVAPENVLLQQFNGVGQIVEFERVADDRTVKVALCNVAQDAWVPVYFFDTIPAKDK